MSDFLIGFTALFSIINPVGMAFVFYDMSRWLTPAEQNRLARRIAVNSLGVLLVSLYFGVYILGFFGITLAALRIGGGLAVAINGWRMLNATGARKVAPGGMDTAPIDRMAFFPLTVPLTTGPGTMATAVALGANHAGLHGLGTLKDLSLPLVAVVMAGAVYVCYRFSAKLSQLLGDAGTEVITRISAFLLLCVGVQIILTGVTDSLLQALARVPS